MESENSWFGSFVDAVWDQIGVGAGYLPSFLAAILILVFGWAVARLARGAVRRLAHASNRFLERAFPDGMLAGARVSSLTGTLLGEVVFWAILFITATIAAGIAGLSAISEWLDRITEYLPQLIAGVTIVVVGFFLSVYVREQVASQTSPDDSGRRMLLGKVVQGLVMTAVLIVGLDQVGIEVALLIALFVVCVAALLIGLSVAFALGARSYISNLIGVRSARRHMSTGVKIRIGDIEGEILEITSAQIALDTDQGKTIVPGKFVDEHVTIIVAPEANQDAKGV